MRAAALRLVDASLATLAIVGPLAALYGLDMSFSLSAFARALGWGALACAGPALVYVVRGGR